MNLILFGPPGAGKGTQSQHLAKRFGYFQVSTGDLLRNEIKNNTDLGKKISNKINNGEFVEDKIVNLLVEKTITNKNIEKKIIFDGYPRNISQAKNLDNVLFKNNQVLSSIIYLDVPRDIIQKRILGRLICEKCNKTLNEFLDIEEIEKHRCGKNYLKKRNDDKLDTIMKRYDTFIKETNPLLEYYSKRISFFKVNGNLKIGEITAKIEEIINA